MKKVKKTKIDDELRAQYDVKLFRGGTRGKYSARFRQGTNLVLLEPDVAAAFPTPAAVNEALRMLINVAHQASSKSRT